MFLITHVSLGVDFWGFMVLNCVDVVCVASRFVIFCFCCAVCVACVHGFLNVSLL